MQECQSNTCLQSRNFGILRSRCVPLPQSIGRLRSSKEPCSKEIVRRRIVRIEAQGGVQAQLVFRCAGKNIESRKPRRLRVIVCTRLTCFFATVAAKVHDQWIDLRQHSSRLSLIQIDGRIFPRKNLQRFLVQTQSGVLGGNIQNAVSIRR